MGENSIKVEADVQDVQHGQSSVHGSHLHRRVGNRQVQLFAIGGSIGTALFIGIGTVLYKAGPAGLLLAYIAYSIMLGLVNNSIAEMSTLMPISGGFVRFAGKWVDESLGFASGLNFFLYEAIQIPFEITALNVVLGFWRNDIPVVAVCLACIVAYGALNIVAVNYYGEAEFWLSSGKVLLVFILFAFTFVTMVGGNPQHDAYGFYHWTASDPFQEWMSTGDLGRFEGFLAALFYAAMMIVGPEYLSIIAAEAKHPRKTIKRAFKTIYWRFAFFFIGGALCVGIVLSSRDPSLSALVVGSASGAGTAAASPYVIAMTNLGITVLPDLVNALILTSIFSAGNTYVYCATRNLYGLAVEGHAPKVFAKTTKKGVPIYAFMVTMLFPFLSLLQLSNSTAQVFDWLINMMTSGGVINFIIMSITYLRFYAACKAQGVDRKSLPYCGWFQPYGAWISLIFLICLLMCAGYDNFLPGNFTASGFLTRYTMVFITPLAYVVYKVVRRTKLIKASEVDLVWERPLVDEYEANLDPDKSPSTLTRLRNLVRRKKHQPEDGL